MIIYSVVRQRQRDMQEYLKNKLQWGLSFGQHWAQENDLSSGACCMYAPLGALVGRDQLEGGDRKLDFDVDLSRYLLFLNLLSYLNESPSRLAIVELRECRASECDGITSISERWMSDEDDVYCWLDGACTPDQVWAVVRYAHLQSTYWGYLLDKPMKISVPWSIHTITHRAAFVRLVDYVEGAFSIVGDGTAYLYWSRFQKVWPIIESATEDEVPQFCALQKSGRTFNNWNEDMCRIRPHRDNPSNRGGPHDDYTDAEGRQWRNYPDGRCEEKGDRRVRSEWRLDKP